MTKADLVEQVTNSIAKTSGPMISKKDCARVVDAFLDAVKDALKGQQNIEIRGFGTFKIRRRKTRTEFGFFPDGRLMMADDAAAFGPLGLLAPGARVDLANATEFRLGQLRIRPAYREVRRGAEVEILEPRVMQVLVALASRVGAVVSRASARLLDALVYGLESSDLASILAGALVILATAALACLVPAVGAARTDPAAVLRVE